MARKVKKANIAMASSAFFLPSAEEIPLLYDVLDAPTEGMSSEEYDNAIAAWWDNVRTALQSAYEANKINTLEEKVTEVETVVTATSSSIAKGTPGASGGTPTSTLTSTWDGGTSSSSAWESSADGGWVGPRIFAMDGGTPFSDYSYIARAGTSEVDEAKTTDLIIGSYSGGTA